MKKSGQLWMNAMQFCRDIVQYFPLIAVLKFCKFTLRANAIKWYRWIFASTRIWAQYRPDVGTVASLTLSKLFWVIKAPNTQPFEPFASSSVWKFQIQRGVKICCSTDAPPMVVSGAQQRWTVPVWMDNCRHGAGACWSHGVYSLITKQIHLSTK